MKTFEQIRQEIVAECDAYVSGNPICEHHPAVADSFRVAYLQARLAALIYENQIKNTTEMRARV